MPVPPFGHGAEALPIPAHLRVAAHSCGGTDRLIRQVAAVCDVERGERYAARRDGHDRRVGGTFAALNVERGEQRAAGHDIRERRVSEASVAERGFFNTNNSSSSLPIVLRTTGRVVLERGAGCADGATASDRAVARATHTKQSRTRHVQKTDRGAL